MNKIYLILFGIFFISSVLAFVPNPSGDYDNDNILNQEDNCYFVYNPSQTDSDGDGKGDVCDPSPFGNCGDNICSGNEDYLSCSQDCETPFIPSCGDNICNGDETETSCAVDCLEEPPEEDEEEDEDESHNHVYRPKQFCEPNWKCGGWSSCNEGGIARKCSDTSNCQDAYNKPNEVASCEIREKVFVEEKNSRYSIIPFGIITLIVLLVLLSVLIKK